MAVTFSLGGVSLQEQQIYDYFTAIWSQADGYFDKYIKDDWAENDEIGRASCRERV